MSHKITVDCNSVVLVDCVIMFWEVVIAVGVFRFCACTVDVTMELLVLLFTVYHGNISISLTALQRSGCLTIVVYI